MVLGRLRGLYSELYDRMIASGLSPGYTPPAAPLYLGLLVLVLGAIAGDFGLAWLAAAIE